MNIHQRNLMVGLCIIFILGMLLSLLIGCKPKSGNYNVDCTHTATDEQGKIYTCTNGKTLRRI